MKKALTLLILVLSSRAGAKMNCNVDPNFVRSSEIQPQEMCIEPGTWNISSKDCRIFAACPLVKELMEKKKQLRIAVSEVGNPAYFLCHRLGATPHQMELKGPKGFEPVSVCLKKGSFMDLDRLMRFYSAR